MRRKHLFGAALILIALPPTLAAGTAWASLGSMRTSVELDRAHLSARKSAVTTTNFSTDTLTLPNGGVTNEYARSDGLVFAVTWQGPSRPDLRQLLGDHFQAFQDDNTTIAHRRARSPLTSNRSDLVVHSGGKSGSFWGFAYIPALVPAGFSAGDLK